MRSSPKENKQSLEDFNKELAELLKKHKVTLYYETIDGDEKFDVRCFRSDSFDGVIVFKDYGEYF